MMYLGDFPASHTALCIPFGSFAAATGADTATTNFAAGDVGIYKDGGTTQRSSSAGITVSTSFDSLTGIQMIIVDLSDNTDAGFYATGHEYQVIVGPITVDGQTLTFPAATFSIERAGGALALLKGNAVKVDVNTIKTNPVVNGGTITFPSNKTIADASLLPTALTSNGNMKSSMVEILTTALTETAGLLAGGFKKFFNIATPASTMDVIARVTLNDTTTINSDMRGTNSAALASVLGTPSGATIEADIAAINVKTVNLPSDPASESTIEAAILAALNTATIPEPTGIPSATPTIVAALAMLVMALREKVVVDSNTGKKSYFNNAGTGITSKTFADTGGVYTENKMGTP